MSAHGAGDGRRADGERGKDSDLLPCTKTSEGVSGKKQMGKALCHFSDRFLHRISDQPDGRVRDHRAGGDHGFKHGIWRILLFSGGHEAAAVL